MERIYNKLVRDNIPKIIENNGEKAICRTLNDDEYWQYLLEKDKEELEEVRLADTDDEIKKELADKLELIRAMAEVKGFSLNDIINAADKKATTNGAFREKIFLEKVIDNK